MLASKLSTALVLLASSFLPALGQVGPGIVTGDVAAHDPTLCKDRNGKYFLFSTAPGIDIRTSTDRTHWTRVGSVFPNGAPWTDTYTGTRNGNLWAPECYYNGNEFLLYYSASSFGSQRSAIFLAKSTTGEPGTWQDLGMVTSSSTANDYNAIDPNLFIENGNWYLSIGSFWSGIKLLRINPSTGKPLSNTVTSLARRTTAGGAVEASTIYKYGNYYYLFTSWDKCCSGTSSTYNIRVGRSTRPDGGYVDRNNVPLTNGGGTLVLASHGRVIGPGGQDVYTDGDGPIIVYHYYTPSGHALGINRLDFSSGWPVIV
ncbi:secreted arabinase [Coprinopsis cinerea okayama7|uniref:Arabinan endo-1,5-alpha-L-arabinosidase n=1 Tax=Coprinopsis cinerea (strain Okayama-7 / 130 / ATCC MYA-4618 / FGSC 9003) TaxID=240176 RepID=A8N9A2_COPC7|nr:secreted arabinase [Coprinopsis cinerea okayama7\|eukprot:XP_001831430.2 secreted arabinase [Coprinopsis cinerea okayama7\